MQVAENLPRYRTIQQCLLEIKKIDKESAISEFLIRSLCNRQRIAHIKTGNKSLINLDNLLQYLCGDLGAQDEE